jgi:HAE1 family hydrophobic/amphiphilic exporter-1
MMQPAEFALKRPVTTSMVFVSFLLVGLIASRLLPLEFFPEVDGPVVMVQIPYPSSTPEEVERQITRPVEESIATLSGIKRMQSESSESQSQVVVFFDWGRDISIMAVEARERVEAIRDELPSDIQHINVQKFSTGDQPVLNLRISSERDLSDSYQLLERKLKRPIERLPGVSQVTLHGVEPKEIRVDLDADRVATHGIDLNQLQERIQQANFALSAGEETAQGQRFRVKPEPRFQSIEDIRDLRIGSGSLRLSDIANVNYVSPKRDYGRHLDRRYAIGLEIYKERGANLVEVGRRVVEAIDQVRDDPEMRGIEMVFLENQAEGVVSSLKELGKSGLIGALLALVVLYLFLRDVPTTLMVTLAVPIAMTVTLACMYFIGISLNILSMMGLLLAVGMLVDNAVVVSESIYRQRELHPGDPHAATLTGVRQVGLAVTAGTLTSIIVFLPNIFGEQSQIAIFLSHVAISICIALLASLLIAQTMIPLIASRLKPPKERRGGLMERARHHYGRVLAWTLRHRWASALVIVLVVLSVAVPFPLVKKDMFPEEGQRRLMLFYNLSADYPLDVVEPVVDRIENYLYDNAEEFNIRSVYSYFTANGQAQSTIYLHEDDRITRGVKEIREAIREGLPKIAIGSPSFDRGGGPGGESMQVQLLGNDSERLRSLAEDLERLLGRVEGIVDVRSQAGSGSREVRVRVDRERAIRQGFTAQQVGNAVGVALRGREVTQYRGRDGEVAVRLGFPEDQRRTLDQLRTLTLTRADGSPVALETLVDMEVTDGPATIRRENRKTALGVEFGLKDLSPPEARERVRGLMEQFALPSGYDWNFGQSFFQEQEEASRMVFNILVAIAVIYLVMAALFESLIYPAAIITTIGFSIVGVFWFFLITGTTFSMMAMIGILILIGVVVNNGIVMVDHINQLRLSGMARAEAVVQGGRDRLRPILMTVATTVLGLVPLCISNAQIGGGGPPYYPMARAIVGGLLFSTLVSLLMLPTIYVFMDDLRHWARDVLRRGKGSRRIRELPVAADKS